jgi:hypothetical protein
VLDVYGSLLYAGARTLQARLPEGAEGGHRQWCSPVQASASVDKAVGTLCATLDDLEGSLETF